jgi:TetR/AcrR family transcriptional regulator, cholesterol catabolism regulator
MYAGAETVMKKRGKKNEIETQIKNGELVRQRHLQIAAGATKLFIKQGYFKTSIREISKATGLTIGNLYDYITKKEDILYLVFDVFHSVRIRKLEDEGIFKIEDPVEQLKQALRVILENVNIHKDMVLLMYTEGKLLPKEFLIKILENESGMVRTFEEILKKGVEKGVFKIKDPFLLANVIVYLLSVEPLRGWNFRKRYSVHEINDFIIDLILGKMLGISKK